MIERAFVAEKIKEFQIQEYIQNNLRGVGHSHTRLQRTPLGEKIIIYASRPGLIVGRKGANIKKLTATLKKKFNLENPQIEISEVENIDLDPNIIAERIANSLERFGSSKFKGVGHKMMENVMSAGALGVEIIISGKVPSRRAKSWRFYNGYLKKCGDISIIGVKKAHADAHLKTGAIGIKVSIMPPDTKLPDDINLVDEAPAKEDTGESKEETEDKDESKGSVKEKKELKKPETRKKRTAKKEVKSKSKQKKKTKESKENEGKGFEKHE